MRRLAPLFLSALVLLAVSAGPAAAQTVNITIGKGLPVGMKIFVTIGGEGCNCTGAATAVVGRGGSATVSIEMNCTPSGHPPTPGPNANVRVMARALDEEKGTQYKGTGRLTGTSTANVFQSRFNLATVPPRP